MTRKIIGYDELKEAGIDFELPKIRLVDKPIKWNGPSKANVAEDLKEYYEKIGILQDD